MAADPQHRADRAEGQHDDHGGQHGAHADTRNRGGEGVLDPVGEAAPLKRFVGEGLHRAHGGDGLIDMVAGVGDAVLAVARQAAHPAAEDDDGQNNQRHDQHHEPGQFRAGHGEQHRAADQHQDIAQRHRDGRAHDHLQHRGVGGQARQDFAGAGDLEERRAQADDMVVDRAAHIGDDSLADPGDQIEAPVTGRRQQGDDSEHDPQGLIEQVRIAAAKAVVDQPAQAEAESQHRARRRGQRQTCPGDGQFIGGYKADQFAKNADRKSVG